MSALPFNCIFILKFLYYMVTVSLHTLERIHMTAYFYLYKEIWQKNLLKIQVNDFLHHSFYLTKIVVCFCLSTLFIEMSFRFTLFNFLQYRNNSKLENTQDRQTLDTTNPRQTNTRHDKP